MSADVSTLVWRSGVYEGSTLVVLLALAEYANPDGTRIYPRLGNLMEKARLSERSTREAIRQLRKDGILILVQEADRRNGLEHEWRIEVIKLYALAYAKWEKDQQGKPPPLPPEVDRQNLPSRQNLPQTEAKFASKAGKICLPPHTPYIDSTVIHPSSTAIPAPNGAAKRRAPSKQRTTMGDYTPSDEARARAAKYWDGHARPDLSVDEEVERFLAHHRSRGTRMADWDSAWQTWYCNALQFNKPPPNGNGHGQGANGAAFIPTDLDGWKYRLQAYYGYFAVNEEDPELASPKGTWIKQWGPPPHDPKNRVPKEAFSAVKPRMA